VFWRSLRPELSLPGSTPLSRDDKGCGAGWHLPTGEPVGEQLSDRPVAMIRSASPQQAAAGLAIGRLTPNPNEQLLPER
jgi:hypothetical protein